MREVLCHLARGFMVSDYNQGYTAQPKTMNLQQLRYLVAIVDHGLNISGRCEVLFTSQPGISKQIRQLEDELGVAIFVRRGKRFTGLTEPGRLVVERARRLVIEAAGLKRIGDEHRARRRRSLTIATTHTQARYVLPPTIKQFTAKLPKVAAAAAPAIRYRSRNSSSRRKRHRHRDRIAGRLIRSWSRCPATTLEPLRDHAARPSARGDKAQLSIEALAQPTIVTYDLHFTGASAITRGVRREGLTPNIALTALDADVIKTYVELGLGVGIVAQMACDAGARQGLCDAPRGPPVRAEHDAYRAAPRGPICAATRTTSSPCSRACHIRRSTPR